MASISDEKVIVGDMVYDLVYGNGVVEDILYNDIVVRFSQTKIKVTYTDGGKYNGIRRLYWHNPVIMEPSKDKTLWEAVQVIITTVVNYLKK